MKLTRHAARADSSGRICSGATAGNSATGPIFGGLYPVAPHVTPAKVAVVGGFTEWVRKNPRKPAKSRNGDAEEGFFFKAADGVFSAMVNLGLIVTCLAIALLLFVAFTWECLLKRGGPAFE